MDRHWFAALAGGMAGAALLAAACAPAAAPKPAEQPATQKPQEVVPLQPKVEAPAPQVQQEKQEKQKPASSATSVTGVPLDPNAKYGGILMKVAGSEGPTFDPWEEANASGPAFNAQQPVMNMIVQNRTWGTAEDFVNAAYFKVQPDLARSWEQSPDGMSWTFKFFDGIKWSDGTPFTCRDAKFTLDSIRTGKGLLRSPRAVHFLSVKEITCADDTTMVISLKFPKASLLEMVAMGYNIVFPAHIYEDNIKELRDKPAKAGTGPFVLKEWVPGEKYVFTRKADYWNKPFPYLDGIQLTLLSTSATVAGLRGGRLDWGSAGSGFSGAQANTLLKECTNCQFFARHLSLGMNFLYINHQRPPWNTPEVKDALSLALDRKKWCQVQNPGWCEPPYGAPYYTGTYWEMPYDRLKAIPGYNFDTPEANQKKAKELLAAAGFKPGDLKVTVGWWLSSSAAVPPLSAQEDLKAIGIDVQLEGLETARAYDVLSAADFDLRVHGHYVGTFDPDVTLYEHFYTGSDRNYGRYSNPTVDRLINEQATTLDPAERRRKAWDVAEIILREQAKIFITMGSPSVPVFGPRVRGIMPGNVAIAGYGPWGRFEHAWLAEK